ncbi:hypothetical protein EYF80_037793 [Liparis tanakae]|uniref:Uncharacterized protein n=1 Tax=Liparis tanakae TaxID=230148 RepID=A0A4Z2GEQ8_9TELE|nr:hypothetical protein EYF80_037793 [Liparis tanakae]
MQEEDLYLRQSDMLLWGTPAAAERGSLPLIEARCRQRASISCELTSRKSHIWLESQKFTTLK